MGNPKSRAFMLQQAADAAWEHIRTEARPASRDVSAGGIGHLRMQLIVCPAFEESQAWEVRQGQDDWWLFRPRVVKSWPDVQLIGYDPVPFDTAVLASFFCRVTELSLPICPDLSGYAGCDGTTYQFAVFGDRYSAWRFQWWTNYPPQWQPLVDIANDMLRAFEAV